jgi:hypothetical protein
MQMDWPMALMERIRRVPMGSRTKVTIVVPKMRTVALSAVSHSVLAPAQPAWEKRMGE